ncbi:hypothetical protein NQZ68_003076 [Dissostichus eleginoides]|nr:hypothetical protein NQZ68_003076 [Dissostichus eleginoides]
MPAQTQANADTKKKRKISFSSPCPSLPLHKAYKGVVGFGVEPGTSPRGGQTQRRSDDFIPELDARAWGEEWEGGMKAERWMQQSPESVLKSSGCEDIPPAGEDDIRTPPPFSSTASPEHAVSATQFTSQRRSHPISAQISRLALAKRQWQRLVLLPKPMHAGYTDGVDRRRHREGDRVREREKKGGMREYGN